MKHVRANKETVEKEIIASGFEQVDAPKIGLKEKLFYRLSKGDAFVGCQAFV